MLLKTTTLAWQAGHCNKDERLKVEDNILLLKKQLCQGKHDTT